MTSNRPRIFVLHAKLGSLQPVSGDRIETIRFMKTLNQFADVYYNSMKFDPSRDDLGLHEREVTPPVGDYDLYYVRANHDFFKQLPSPKITMAYPYEPEIFAEADAILITTSEWKRLLESYNEDSVSRATLAKWYPAEGIVKPKRLINIRQTIDPSVNGVSLKKIDLFRARLTNGEAIGYFGRVTEESMPRIFLSQYSALRKKFPSVVVAMAGNIRAKLSPDILNLGRIDYADMPNLVRACSAIISNEEKDAEFLGSGKVLEAVGAAIPIITKSNPVRDEQLGVDYPLYYTTPDEAFSAVDDLLSKPSVATAVQQILEERRQIFSVEAQGRFVAEGLGPMLP